MWIVYLNKKNNNHRTNLVKVTYGMHTKGNIAKIVKDCQKIVIWYNVLHY